MVNSDWKDNMSENEFRDYLMKIKLENSDWVCIRPSGTEPKLKIYIFANGQKRVDELKDIFEGFIK